MNESVPGLSRCTAESTVRSITIEGNKCACVYDVIHMVTGAKDAAKRMQFKRIPEDLKAQCKRWQFPGERQKEVAVASSDTMIGIICALPGDRAKKLRSKCIKIVEKILNGPVTTSSEDDETHTNKMICKFSNEETKIDTLVEVTTVQLPLDVHVSKKRNVRGKPRTKTREPWAMCVSSDKGYPHRTCEFRLIQDLFDAFPSPVLSKRKLYEAKNQNILVSGWYIMDKTTYDDGFPHIDRATAIRSPSHPDWFAVDENLVARASTPTRERKRSDSDRKRRNDSSSSSSWDSDEYITAPPPPSKRQCREPTHRIVFEHDDDFTGINADLSNSPWNFYDKLRTVQPIAVESTDEGDTDTAENGIVTQATTQANAYKTEQAIERRMEELRHTYKSMDANFRKRSRPVSSSSSAARVLMTSCHQDVLDIPVASRRTRGSKETITSRAVFA